MNLFQYLTLPITIVLLIWNLIRLVSRRGSRNIALLGSLIWLSASVAILKLDLTILIARFLGIGRGADLVLYFLVITFLIWMFHIYQRFQRLEEKLPKTSGILRYRTWFIHKHPRTRIDKISLRSNPDKSMEFSGTGES